MGLFQRRSFFDANFIDVRATFLSRHCFMSQLHIGVEKYHWPAPSPSHRVACQASRQMVHTGSLGITPQKDSSQEQLGELPDITMWLKHDCVLSVRIQSRCGMSLSQVLLTDGTLRMKYKTCPVEISNIACLSQVYPFHTQSMPGGREEESEK